MEKLIYLLPSQVLQKHKVSPLEYSLGAEWKANFQTNLPSLGEKAQITSRRKACVIHKHMALQQRTVSSTPKVFWVFILGLSSRVM